MRMRPALAVVSLAACGIGLNGYPDTGDDGAVQVASIDPSWGPPEGGTSVTITGTGFEGPVEVAFGTFDLAVTKLDGETVLVTSPAIGAELAVDVVVRSDLGEAVVPGGFTFSRDPVDTGDTDDTGVTPTGRIGGVVQMSLVQYACPACLGLSSDLEISSVAGFHEPADTGWTDWLPAVGSCALNPVVGGPSATLIDVGEWVHLTSGSRSISMRRTTGTSGILYEASNLSNDDFVRNSAWDVGVPDGGVWGPFDVVDAALTPQGFTDIQPVQMLYTQPESAFSAIFSRSGTNTVTWAPSGGTGSFVVTVDAYHGGSGAYLGTTLCRGSDNGAMGIPGTTLASFPANALLLVTLYRYQIEEGLLPNGSTLQSVAQVGVMGTGLLR